MAKESKNLFPLNSIKFLKKLSKNNNREWFNENRELYEKELLVPAQEFVVELGGHLQQIAPEMNAIPKVDKSIFRLHRDVRFSKNKEPYKTNLGILFWEGSGKKMESSGLYFHVDPNKYFIASGLYGFTKEQLIKYRELVGNKEIAAELLNIVTTVESNGAAIGGEMLKKAPRGFDPEYEFIELAKRKGLYSYFEGNNNVFKETSPIEIAIEWFVKFKPLHDWFLENLM